MPAWVAPALIMAGGVAFAALVMSVPRAYRWHRQRRQRHTSAIRRLQRIGTLPGETTRAFAGGRGYHSQGKPARQILDELAAERAKAGRVSHVRPGRRAA